MEIDLNQIRQHKLMIATPMYGGVCQVNFALSLSRLAHSFGINGVDYTFTTMWNEALITRARNNLVKKFLESDFDLFLFIDSDIGFDWESVYEAMHIMINSDDKKIVCATYPKKSINWNFIDDAYKNNFIDSSEDIAKYSSSFVLNFLNTDNKKEFVFKIDEPLAVQESGTGFMLIHREVFENFMKEYPEKMSIDPDTQKELFYFFDCEIDPKTKYYLSEDYLFCQKAGKIGYKTWVLPWVYLSHTGSYTFSGSFSETSKLRYELQKKKKGTK